MKITKILVVGQVVLGAIAAGVAFTRPSSSGEAQAKTAAVAAARPAAPLEAHPAKAESGHDDVRLAAVPGVAVAPHGHVGGRRPAGAAALGQSSRDIAQALLDGNRRFVAGERAAWDLPGQREATAAEQKPPVMVLGCADSRVSPELVFDRGLGELFVVRSAGNIAEPVAVGSLEYAAEHLHAKVLVVMGHDKCGAVHAALSEEKMPTPNLEAVVSYIAPAVKGLKAWAEGDNLTRMAVEANVQRQAQELLKASPVLRKAVTDGQVTLLKAVYDVESGAVRPLP